MVAFEFNPLYYSLIVFFSAIIPGVALGWPFLKKSEMSVLEKLLLCFFIGLFAVPTLLFLEGLLGIKFSLPLVLADLLLITAAGLALGARNGAFGLGFAPKLPQLDKDSAIGFAKAHGPSFLLLLAMLLAFWIRIQTYSPVYSELDPYYYVYGTGQIIREGMVPKTDDTAWWPQVNNSHRVTPLKMYVEAELYALYTRGGEYNNYLLFTTSGWLPPISAALLSFGAYLLVASIYGRRYGTFAAFVMAFLPSTIFKMSAGVNESAPEGMMMLFLAIGLLAWALARKDQALKLVASFAFFATVASSNFQSVIALPFAGMVALQAVKQFIEGKYDEHFSDVVLFALGGLVAGNFITYALYENVGFRSLLQGPMIISIGAVLLLNLVKYALQRVELVFDRRLAALGACSALLILLYFLTPLGGYIRGPMQEYLGAVEFTTPLSKTIAEQNLAGSSFEGEGGFLALLPANHVDANAKGMTILTNAIYGGLDAIAAPFTMMANIVFKIMDAVFGFVLGSQFATGNKQTSLFAVFFIISIVGLALKCIKKEERGDGSGYVALLILLTVVPILYVSVNKIKFTVFAGLMIAITAAAGIAELERFFAWLARKFKLPANLGGVWVATLFSILLLLTVYAQAAGPIGYAKLFLIKSFEPRYQDDPAKMAPKTEALCDGLMKKGVPYDQVKKLCDAANYTSFASKIDSQFDFDVCWLSQMTVDELIPGPSQEAQSRSSEAATSARLRCNRLADYWIDSMDWINKNLNYDDRVTSWWDYGHWINYFGDRKTVLRNEHASTGMIGRVAHDYIIGNITDLKESMNYFDSRYVLFDVELIGGSTFGGKYGALNYLGCVHEKETTLKENPGTSDCEFNHSPERIIVPKAQAGGTCTISESQQRTGLVAYAIGKQGIDQTRPVYCIGEVTLSTGEKISGTYYYDRKDENGDLSLSKGFVRKIDENVQSATFEMVYNEMPVWPSGNGTYVNGMEDAKTKFYTSNMYRAFYLENLPGFDLVYKSKGGEVKIYRMQNFTGNKAGWIDSVEAARIG